MDPTARTRLGAMPRTSPCFSALSSTGVPHACLMGLLPPRHPAQLEDPHCPSDHRCARSCPQSRGHPGCGQAPETRRGPRRETGVLRGLAVRVLGAQFPRWRGQRTQRPGARPAAATALPAATRPRNPHPTESCFPRRYTKSSIIVPSGIVFISSRAFIQRGNVAHTVRKVTDTALKTDGNVMSFQKVTK